jgi:regulator of cell morphogenesis and NO signaling
MVGKVFDLARDALAESSSTPVAAAPAPPPRAPSAPAKRERNWEMRSQVELIEHIVSHHHEGLRRDLPKLVAAARRLEREQAQHPAFPRGLTDMLAELASELEAHMWSEESSLFPTLRTGARRGPIDMQVRMMARDHDGHRVSLERIRARTANLTAPADASPEWTQLYAGIAGLESDLREHVYLEDNILFARASGGSGG